MLWMRNKNTIVSSSPLFVLFKFLGPNFLFAHMGWVVFEDETSEIVIVELTNNFIEPMQTVTAYFVSFEKMVGICFV